MMQVPRVRPALARLLIEQNKRRLEPQRDWKEVKELVDQMAQAEPESVQCNLVRAELLFAQGDQTAVVGELEKAQSAVSKERRDQD